MRRTSFPDKWLARSEPRIGFALILGLVVLIGGARWIADQAFETDRGARWIWAAGDYRDGESIAFYAVRDLKLAAAGFNATGAGASARIAITADETYLLFVNGRRIGAGRYLSEGPMDLYEIGEYLDPGWNRIIIEARSSRGAGGAIAELELDGRLRPTPAETSPSPKDPSLKDPWYVVTDDRWLIFRHCPSGLFGGLAIENGEPPKVWGRPPTGRWRLTTERQPRSIPLEGYLAPERRPPLRRRSQHTTSWLDLEAGREMMSLGPQQLFDWGTEVEGILSFNLRSAAGEPGLLYVSTDEPPDETTDRPDAVVMPVPGRRFWEDAEPRRFRYALLVGAEPLSRIEVDVLEAEVARQLRLPVNTGGVFGIKPPRSYSKAQESVWGRLEDESERQEAIE